MCEVCRWAATLDRGASHLSRGLGEVEDVSCGPRGLQAEEATKNKGPGVRSV